MYWKIILFIKNYLLRKTLQINTEKAPQIEFWIATNEDFAMINIGYTKFETNLHDPLSKGYWQT